MKTTRKIILSIGFAVAAIGFSSCHTVQGVGQDIENAGEHLQEAAH